MNIKFSTYKNKKSIVIENELIRAEFTPNPGGKMVSLISKSSGYEFLVQRPGNEYKEVPFDGLYTEGECSGYDDMFPTIDACEYMEDPWKGIKMADHGEVWSLPWNYSMKKESVEFQVNGIRFPYELKKRVSIVADNVLRLSYSLQNKSEHDFEFLWAGHFMFNIEEGTRVVVPDDCRKAVSILSNSTRANGEILDWPNFKDDKGGTYRADISRSPLSKGFEKYYFQNKLSKGRCELHYPEEDKRLVLCFSSETVPYLGILMNENGWDNLYNIFIEPCTVCYDRPDVAKLHGQVSKVSAWGEYNWYIDLTL